MYDSIPQDCFKLINTLKSKHPSLQQIFNDIESNLNQRLWYQVTENLTDLASSKEMQESTDLIEIYQGLLTFIEPVMNPMKFLNFVQKMLSNFKGRMNESLTFIANIEAKNKYQGEPKIFLKIIKGFCYLELNQMYDLEDIIKEVYEDFNGKVEIDQSTYSLYYKLSMIFYEKQNDYDNFYSNAFQYLAYENKISNEEKIDLCFKMCIAILIGEKSYNFAELIEKDFFKMMQGTKYEWIANLILTFNSANVEQFLILLNQNINLLNQFDILRNNIKFLEIKIRIAAMLDLIFQKNKNERTLSFDEICKACKTENDKIEYLCMKALSLGLIKGYVDQVQKIVVVNWIQPKYLDKDKLILLKDRFQNWIEKSDKMMMVFKDNAGELVKS